MPNISELKELIEKEEKTVSDNKILNQTELDKLLLTLTAGAFAVSITFFTSIADKIINEGYLFWVWKTLLLVLILQIINYTLAIYISETGIQRLGQLRAEFFKKSPDEASMRDVADRWVNFMRHRVWMNRIVNSTNPIVALLVIAALIGLVRFGITNVIEIKARTQDETKIMNEELFKEELERVGSAKPATINNIYFQLEK